MDLGVAYRTGPAPSRLRRAPPPLPGVSDPPPTAARALVTSARSGVRATGPAESAELGWHHETALALVPDWGRGFFVGDKTMKKRILTGDRPTGPLHLG